MSSNEPRQAVDGVGVIVIVEPEVDIATDCELPLDETDDEDEDLANMGGRSGDEDESPVKKQKLKFYQRG